MTNQDRFATIEAELLLLRKENADLKELIRKLGLESIDLDTRLKAAAEIVIQTQPILGRLLATAVVLQKKGVLSESDLRKVEEEHVEMFLATTHKKPAEEVRDKSNGERPVASYSGSLGSSLLGGPSVGRSSACDTQSSNDERTIPDGLQSVRTTYGTGDGVVDVSAPKTPDIPA